MRPPASPTRESGSGCAQAFCPPGLSALCFLAAATSGRTSQLSIHRSGGAAPEGSVLSPGPMGCASHALAPSSPTAHPSRRTLDTAAVSRRRLLAHTVVVQAKRCPTEERRSGFGKEMWPESSPAPVVKGQRWLLRRPWQRGGSPHQCSPVSVKA